MAITEETLNLNDKTNMRLALEERIISLLRIFRGWTPEVLDTLQSYHKVGGYFFQEDFEELAKVSVRREQ